MEVPSERVSSIYICVRSVADPCRHFNSSTGGVMKILNLYAGIGGNRKLWTPKGNEHDITAVEYKPEIAAIYQDFFPNDKVIITDAHQYLLNHFAEYDFIWTSPPCPSHSRFRFMTTKMTNPKYSRPVVYPDMALYQEIILLKHYFGGKWVVENVKGYYEPLIKTQKIDRHYIWANFLIPSIWVDNVNFIKKHAGELDNRHDFDLSKYKLSGRKDQILRNCVDPTVGKRILEYAINPIKTQGELI